MAGYPPVTSQPPLGFSTFSTNSGEVGSPEYGVPTQLAPLSNLKHIRIEQVLHALEGIYIGFITYKAYLMCTGFVKILI